MTRALHLDTQSAAFAFAWDLLADRAHVTRRPANEIVWAGSLLPLFWVAAKDGRLEATKAVAVAATSRLDTRRAEVDFALPGHGTGHLQLTWSEGAVKIERIEVSWDNGAPPPIHSLHFGCNVLDPAQRAAAPSLDLPFWPTWRAEGFCVASAKTNPIQSFFRSWDFGQTSIPLGSFGPAMGTPYVAAFPRPTYAGCAGGRHGWVCFGAGTVPDGALTFQVRARSAALEWRYREDLWGAPAGAGRTWDNPLWITWDETAWQAYRNYFRMFPAGREKPSAHQKSFWGTWGDFRLNEFEWRSSVDRAQQMEADLICIDDPWEETKGSCRPHPQRLPNFTADIAYAHGRKLGLGIWMPIAWIEDPAAEGLSSEDLLLSRDGHPVRSNWAIDPHESGQQFYCLDPASARARQFLRERTARVIRDYRPSLLKIDFGYGIPGPDGCTSRDPVLRGERIAWKLAQLIADAAHELDPDVTVLGYSIHPLWTTVQDQVSLDDVGDCGMHEAAGHSQWSIWAALAADRGSALMGSSGYLWAADQDVVMNSAVLGAPGANLPRSATEGSTLPNRSLALRRALFRWHRRTTHWEPLWLDSSSGDLQLEPTLRNWGRLETFADQRALTALALREPSSVALAAPELQGLRWSGRWIVIAQDDRSIFAAHSVALLPLAPAVLELPRARKPGEIRAVFADRDEIWGGWKWRDGILRIAVGDIELGSGLLGLLVQDAAD